MKNVRRILMLGLVFVLFHGCGPKAGEKPVKNFKMEDSEQILIIKIILGGEIKKTPTKGEFIFNIKESDKSGYWFEREEINRDYYVEIDSVVSGFFVKSFKENLIVLHISGPGHTQDFPKYVLTVLDEKNKEIVSEDIEIINQYKILKTKGRNHILGKYLHISHGLWNWSVSKYDFDLNGRYSKKDLMEGIFGYDEKTLVTPRLQEYPPEISDKEIVFPDRSYIWNPDKEEFEKVEKK